LHHALPLAVVAERPGLEDAVATDGRKREVEVGVARDVRERLHGHAGRAQELLLLDAVRGQLERPHTGAHRLLLGQEREAHSGDVLELEGDDVDVRREAREGVAVIPGGAYVASGDARGRIGGRVVKDAFDPERNR